MQLIMIFVLIVLAVLIIFDFNVLNALSKLEKESKNNNSIDDDEYWMIVNENQRLKNLIMKYERQLKEAAQNGTQENNGQDS